VRTRISDHRVWPAFATATYIVCSGDAAILDESAALFGHCARGLVQCLELTGEMDLPLIVTAAGLGTRARQGGCIAPALKAFWEFVAKARF